MGSYLHRSKMLGAHDFQLCFLSVLLFCVVCTVRAETSCHCRDGCNGAGDCLGQGGCFIGWAGKGCTQQTFPEHCTYSDTVKTLDCGQPCKDPALDGQYCSRRDVAFDPEGRVFQDGQIDTFNSINTRKIFRGVVLPNQLEKESVLIEAIFFEDTEKDLQSCYAALKENKEIFDCTPDSFRESKTYISVLSKCVSPPIKTEVARVYCPNITRTVNLAEIKVYKCEDFWFGPENGCLSPCNCQDGVKCDPWTGECPGNSGAVHTSVDCMVKFGDGVSPLPTILPNTNYYCGTSFGQPSFQPVQCGFKIKQGCREDFTMSPVIQDHHSACADGFLGQNCSLPCPQPCDRDIPCDKKTGLCDHTLPLRPTSSSSFPSSALTLSTTVTDSAMPSSSSVSAETTSLTPQAFSTTMFETSTFDLSPDTSATDASSKAVSSELLGSTVDGSPESDDDSTVDLIPLESSLSTSDKLHSFSSTVPSTLTSDTTDAFLTDTVSVNVVTTVSPSLITDSDKLTSTFSGMLTTESVSNHTETVFTEPSTASETGQFITDFTNSSLSATTEDSVSRLLQTMTQATSLPRSTTRKLTETSSQFPLFTGSFTSVTDRTKKSTAQSTSFPTELITTTLKTTEKPSSSPSSTSSVPTSQNLTTTETFTSTEEGITAEISTSVQSSTLTSFETSSQALTTVENSTLSLEISTALSSSSLSSAQTTTTTAADVMTTSTFATESQETSEGNNQDGNSNIDSVVAGVLFALTGCVVVGIVVFALWYHRTLKRKILNTSCEQPIFQNQPENDLMGRGVMRMSDMRATVEDENAANRGDNLYANVSQDFEPTLNPIPVGSFRNHMAHMKNSGGYAKEFQLLPTELEGSCEAATDSISEDVKKNRFKDIIPYDETRVVLTTETEADSDYINASYIDGFAEARAYIAAQGPMPGAVDDFWHMVWVEGCGKIVMLTNLVEVAKIKCERYWPDDVDNSAIYGQYTVKLVSSATHAYYVQRKLSVAKNTAENGDSERSRTIHHFHFTAWPDHGVPIAPAMVEFWQLVRHVPSRLSGPLLVHCSAGVGRTGTYIGLDILVAEASCMDTVSVFPTVRRMRKQRVKMVQTVSQYTFLHEVLAEVLSCQDTIVNLQDLQNSPDWRTESDAGRLPDTVRYNFVSQFQMLERLRPEPTEEELATALLPENAAKNRVSRILPAEKNRACLWTPDEESSDYINAVFLPSMSHQLGFIATQLPLENTVNDFWSMIFDWRVNAVVRFLATPEQEAEVALCPAEGQQNTFASVTVTCESVLQWKLGIKQITLQLLNEEVVESTLTVCMYCVDYDLTASLTDTTPFLLLADALLPILASQPQPPVAVQCFDGASLSCMFCAVLTALQTLQTDGRVSPYTLARLYHSVRPQAFPKLEQYECFVRCLVDHANDRHIREEIEIPKEVVDEHDQGTEESQETGVEDAIYANV